MSVYDNCSIAELEQMYAEEQRRALRYQERRLARRSAWGRDRDGNDDGYALTKLAICEALQKKRDELKANSEARATKAVQTAPTKGRPRAVVKKARRKPR